MSNLLYSRTTEIISAIQVLHASYVHYPEPSDWFDKALPIMRLLVTQEEADIVFTNLMGIDTGLVGLRNDEDYQDALTHALMDLSWYELPTHFNHTRHIDELDGELYEFFKNKE